MTERRIIPLKDGRMLRLLIISPRGLSEKTAGVLWMHGGGYKRGFPEMAFVSRAIDLVKKGGAVVISPEYTLAPIKPYPAAIRDCYAALLYVKKHCGELNIRSDQIMVGGESAGGGLAAALSILARDRGKVNIAFQMPLYPMLDCRATPSSEHNDGKVWNTERNNFAWDLYLRSLPDRESDDVPPYASPSRCTDYSGLPPAYTFVGDLEPFYCETLSYVESLKAAGIEAVCDVYADCYHSFDIFDRNNPKAAEAAERFTEYFLYAKQKFFAEQNS